MIKDFGNQKLPRFKAGQPLLDQVTADRLNDICSMIESSRLQNGVGYMMNRTSNGTTLSIFNSDYTRPPKLWKVSFTDIDISPVSIAAKVVVELTNDIIQAVSTASQFKTIFNGYLSKIISAITTGNAGSANGVQGMILDTLSPVFDVISTVDEKVESMLDKAVPIGATLESYFAARGKRPRNGDMIYTNEFGICYTIYKETSDNDGTYPTPNLLFRVPFTVGATDENAGQKYYALTTFPTPDIAEIIKSTMSGIVNFTGTLLGNTFEGLVQSIMDSVSEALFALYTLLWDTIQEILESISALLDKINSISDLLDSKVSDFTTRIGALEKLLYEASTLSVLAADGYAHSITVLNDIKGDDVRSETSWLDENGRVYKGKQFIWEFQSLTTSPLSEITWIDSKNGAGHKAKTFLWNDETPNVENVDWQYMDYINADGSPKKRKVLLLSDVPEDVAGVKSTQVTVCEDGETTVKTFLETPNS